MHKIIYKLLMIKKTTNNKFYIKKIDGTLRRNNPSKMVHQKFATNMSVENDLLEIFDKNVGENDLGKFMTQISVCNKS